MKKINNKKGFTIVELVIVIAVIGVLAAILIPTFINLNNRAKVANTTSFLKNVNTQIAAKNANPDIDDVVFDKLTGRKTIVTDTDGIVYAQKQGFDIETISPFDGNEIVWDMKNAQFAFVKEGEIDPVYAEAGFSWDNVQKMPETAEATTNALAAGEKVYLRRDLVLAEEITVSNSVDMGSNSSVKKIIYSHTTAPAQTVVIRTNSADVELEVTGYVDPTDSTKGDVIYHYGPSGALNIIKCATASYHEAGKSAFAEISAGRIVFEEGSLIDHLHINKNESTGKFDEVIVKDNGAGALPEKITRDEVEVSVEEGSIDVVTVETKEGVQEVVKVYADGSVGSTEKVTEGENKQNENVNSALGQLVLDNGSDAGEKAMSNNEKTSTKQEVVETAQNEEELSDAEDSGYEITHHDALEPTCTEDGHTAYDSYFVNAEEQKVGYKVIPALDHDVNSDTGVCNRCNDQIYVYKVGNALYKSNQFSAAWSAAKNSSNSFKILCDLTLNVIQADGRFTLDLNGKTLTLRGHASLSGAVHVYGLTDYGGDLTIKNGTLQLPGTNNINYGIYSEGNLNVENVTINSACKTTVYVDGLAWNSVGSANLTNVVINATHASGTAYNAHSVSMYGTTYSPVSNLTNVTITSANDAVMINATNANLHSCNITASGRAAWIIFSATGNTIGTMTIDGETTLNAGSAYNRLNAQDGNTIVIEAGTYNFDPTNYVNTEAFDIAENAGVYTVSSK